jgi:hypothetical protein
MESNSVFDEQLAFLLGLRHLEHVSSRSNIVDVGDSETYQALQLSDHGGDIERGEANFCLDFLGRGLGRRLRQCFSFLLFGLHNKRLFPLICN